MSKRKYTISEHGPRIEAFLKRILQLAGLKLTFELSEEASPHPDFENPEIRVKFSGDDVSELIANKTELLLALEHLTMEMLGMPGEDHSLICFDANDHRMLRIEELRFSAVTAAERVKTTRTPFRFNPMNSRERRILHMALRNEPEVRSESEGFEPRRNVVIYPAGMPSSPRTAAPPVMRRGRRR
ncbi:MAG: single-stranded DNA-binding protein [Acidimicrobiia bacterium]|nr:single-stranded DNA-binding protein [Acidimicrobiia bacterium]